VTELNGIKVVKEDALSFHYGNNAKLVQLLREQHRKDGEDPATFPQFLEENGVKMVGPLIVIDDKFDLMARLKFSNTGRN
jgi:hypothetical protein